jgi:hypothetical protein
VRSQLAKLQGGEAAHTDAQPDAAVRQIVSRAVVPEGGPTSSTSRAASTKTSRSSTTAFSPRSAA